MKIIIWLKKMEFNLSKYQQDSLRELFKDNQLNFGFLFSMLEAKMVDNFLPDKGKRNVIANEKAQLLTEISAASKKLNKLIVRLDDTARANVNSAVASRIFEEYNYQDTFKYFEDIDSLAITDTLIKYCEFHSGFIKSRWGRSYMDQVIDAICQAWPIELAMVRKVTKTGKLVRFFSIVLEDDSYEKIYLQIKSSRWYKQHFITLPHWEL